MVTLFCCRFSGKTALTVLWPFGLNQIVTHSSSSPQVCPTRNVPKSRLFSFKNINYGYQHPNSEKAYVSSFYFSIFLYYKSNIKILTFKIKNEFYISWHYRFILVYIHIQFLHIWFNILWFNFMFCIFIWFYTCMPPFCYSPFFPIICVHWSLTLWGK